MGRKTRNRNKGDRDDYALPPSSSKRLQAAEEEEASETESIATHLTLEDDVQSVINGDDNDTVVFDADDALDNLSEYLENAASKRDPIRLAALDMLRKLLTRCSMADDLSNWKVTLLGVIEKALRKADEELERAAILAALVSLQLGREISDEIEPIIDIMRDITTDASRAESARVHCANAAALCSYLSVTQSDSLRSTLNALRAVWTSAKSNISPTAHTHVFSSAVAGWSLLVCQAGRHSLETALQDQPKLCTFLDAAQVSMRMSAAEALGVLYETATAEFGETYHFPNHNHLLELLHSLITDSLKYRAKKDRRMQRHTIRHVYSAIKDQEVPSMQIKFGSEMMSLDSCGEKLLYSVICDVLKGGMNAHLKANPLLREVFDLGPPKEDLPSRMPKLQRLAIQNAVNKERDIKRGKQRDKRAC